MIIPFQLGSVVLLTVLLQCMMYLCGCEGTCIRRLVYYLAGPEIILFRVVGPLAHCAAPMFQCTGRQRRAAAAGYLCSVCLLPFPCMTAMCIVALFLYLACAPPCAGHMAPLAARCLHVNTIGGHSACVAAAHAVPCCSWAYSSAHSEQQHKKGSGQPMVPAGTQQPGAPLWCKICATANQYQTSGGTYLLPQQPGTILA